MVFMFCIFYYNKQIEGIWYLCLGYLLDLKPSDIIPYYTSAYSLCSSFTGHARRALAQGFGSAVSFI